MMKSQHTIVACRSRWLSGIVTAILLVGAANVASAKSLYVITEIVPMAGDTPIKAYDIGATGLLTYQTTMTVPFFGGGGVGLAIDSDSETLFITYEYTNDIRVLNARTLDQATLALAPDANNLAGIVFDHDKRMLYAIDRGESHLYCYKWDAINKQLNLVQGSPFELHGAVGFGLALDEVEDRLYVGSPNREVRVYSTSDWSLVRTIPLNRTLISVAVDSTRHYLYGGGGYVENYDLTQYNLTTGEEKDVQVTPAGGVMGLAVDPATGYVYVTNGRDNRTDPNGDDRNDLRVYDSRLTLIQTLEHFARDPTGIAVPGKQTSYNPLHLIKNVQQTVAGLPSGAVPEVPIDREFTYTICFDHNDYYLTDISVLDTLPAQVTFVRADGDGTYGQYDRTTHTYLWTNPPLGAGSTTCLSLVARVKPDVAAGTSITNNVTIDTAQTPPTTTACEAVAAVIAETYKPLTLSKTVVSTDADAGNATGTLYAKAGGYITYRICYDNRTNTRPVNNVTLVDALPGEVTFIRADDNGRSGVYNSLLHTYTWSFSALAAGAEGCLELMVQVNRNVAGGSTITNRVTIDSDEATATTATAAVVLQSDALVLSKRITSGATPNPLVPGQLLVRAGTDITYEICLSNTSATRAATYVAIVDTLPAHTSFVSAEGDGVNGYYDAASRTYTWSYGTLAPLAQDCLDIILRVDEDAAAGTVITNSVTVSGRQMPSASTTVDVVVSEPTSVVDASMFITPTTLYRTGRNSSLMVVMHLPQGMGRELIANVLLTLDPGGVQPFNQVIFGTSAQGKVQAFFDPTMFLNANPNVTGRVLVTVTGQLTDGRFFRDKEDITIK